MNAPLPFYALLAVAAVAAVLTILHRVLGRDKKSLSELVMIALGLGLIAMLPPDWRKWIFMTFGGLVGFYASSGNSRFGIAFFLGGVFWLIETVIPGGTSALILVLLALIGYFKTRSAGAHLRRLRRARTLHSGQRTTREVEVAGIVSGPDTTIPGLEERAAAWSLGPVSSEFLVIDSQFGPVYVALKDAELDCDGVMLSSEQKRGLFEAHQSSPPPHMKETSSSSQLKLLRANEPAYVIGLPEWEPPPRGGTGYRDAEKVPVFRHRSRETRGVYVANRSESEIRRESWWTLSSWASWGAVCLLLAYLQYQGM